MARLQTVYLEPQEIDRIVTPLLNESFGAYGFHGKTIEEDETFSGDPIIRVRAEVETAVPADKLVAVLSRIHQALRTHHDERIVFLSAPGPALAQSEGDEDEDSL